VTIAVVENKAVILSRRRSQATPNHLHEENLAFGRASEDDASHVPIDSRCETTNVADDLYLSRMEAPLDFEPFARRGEGVDIGGLHTGSLKVQL
jgi:hypothetical protein